MIKTFYTKYFFIAMAVLFIIFAVAGFVPDYQLIRQQHIRLFWFAHVHGIIMTAWLLVYLTQAILVNNKQLQLHRKLGLVSVGLGIFVWLSMGIVVWHSNITMPGYAHAAWANFLFLGSTTMLFALFFAWGIVRRKNAGAHKRLLYIATMIVIAAGYNRVIFNLGASPTLSWFNYSTRSGFPNPSGMLLYDDLLLIPLFIYDLLLLRSVHKTTWVSAFIIILVHLTLLLSWRFLP
jgi:hypothetical protein